MSALTYNQQIGGQDGNFLTVSRQIKKRFESGFTAKKKLGPDAVLLKASREAYAISEIRFPNANIRIDTTRPLGNPGRKNVFVTIDRSVGQTGFTSFYADYWEDDDGFHLKSSS